MGGPGGRLELKDISCFITCFRLCHMFIPISLHVGKSSVVETMLFMVVLATVFHSGAVVQVEAVQVGHVVAVGKW